MRFKQIASLGKVDLYVCGACGAAVVDRRAHERWHKEYADHA